MEGRLCGGSRLPAANIFLLLKHVLLCGSVAVCRGSGHREIKFESDTNYTTQMEEWMCGGSRLPAANIFYFLSMYCSVAVWQGSGHSEIKFNFALGIIMWLCGGVAGLLKFESDTNLVKGSAKA